MAYNKNANIELKSRLMLATLNVMSACTSFRITEREKEMVRMFVGEEKPIKDIAEHYGLKRQRVEAIIRHILARMEKLTPEDNYFLGYQALVKERDQLRQELNSLRYAKQRIGKDYQPEDHYDGVLLSDCELSTRVRHAFERYYPEVKTIEQLSRYSKKQLLKMPKFGLYSIKEVEVLLAKFGYQLLP